MGNARIRAAAAAAAAVAAAVGQRVAPLPVAPTNATVLPPGTLNDTCGRHPGGTGWAAVVLLLGHAGQLCVYATV